MTSYIGQNISHFSRDKVLKKPKERNRVFTSVVKQMKLFQSETYFVHLLERDLYYDLLAAEVILGGKRCFSRHLLR